MRIQINSASHDYAGTTVITGINASISTGDHIGIVGANGCGKTTLVRIIAGLLEPSSGTVVREPGTTVGYVPQTLDPGDAVTVGDYLLGNVFAMRERLGALEHTMGDDPENLERILRDYQDERERYDHVNGDTGEERAERLLAELGLPSELEQEIATLSGGEQNVLALARAVIGRPDLLILDEPGNHLDFAGLAWLESYLARYPGAVLVVSHNRYLLDQVASTIWMIERGTLAEYTGSYSDYRFTRLSQALSGQATYAVQQRKLARLEEIVRLFEERARVTGDARWGKRLRSRRTQIKKARQAMVDAPTLGDAPIKVSFHSNDTRSDIALEVRDYSKVYGDRVLFEGATLHVPTGARVGIVGPNGSGKTTLLKELVSLGAWDNDVLRIGPSMRVGYCAQQRGRFSPAMIVMDAMLSVGSFTRNEIFSVLSRLRFAWEDLDRPVASLSGGEWNRLQLALAIIGRANLLILDEPTNHLDIPSREAVEEALGEFDGTIVAVSHDRYFLEAVAQTIVEVADCRLQVHEGSFTEFWYARRPLRTNTNIDLKRRRQAVRSDTAASSGGRTGPREAARATETEILGLEDRQRALETQMEEAFARNDYRAGRDSGRELAKVRRRIDELYERWGTE